MKITLKQFTKFAVDNDILWYYNKPHWHTTPFDFDSKYNKKQLDEIRRMYKDNPKGLVNISTFIEDPDILPEDIEKMNFRTTGRTNLQTKIIMKSIENFTKQKREETMNEQVMVDKPFSIFQDERDLLWNTYIRLFEENAMDSIALPELNIEMKLLSEPKGTKIFNKQKREESMKVTVKAEMKK